MEELKLYRPFTQADLRIIYDMAKEAAEDALQRSASIGSLVAFANPDGKTFKCPNCDNDHELAPVSEALQQELVVITEITQLLCKFRDNEHLSKSMKGAREVQPQAAAALEKLGIMTFEEYSARIERDGADSVVKALSDMMMEIKKAGGNTH